MPSSSAKPPGYSRFASRYQMKWPLVIFSGLAFIWALASGIYSIRDTNADGETSKEKLFDVILGILYFVVAGAAALAFAISAVKTPQSVGPASQQNAPKKVKYAKVLLIAAPVGMVVAIAAQIIAVVAHYVVKTDSINQCIKATTGAIGFDRFGDTTVISQSDASNLCNDAWDRGTWRVFAWLVVVTLFSIFFASIAYTYYIQLVSGPPSFTQSIPLQPYANNPPPPENYNGQGFNEQSWMVPPYPGPPPGTTPGAYEKGEFHPDAEWAQTSYAPPPGPPPPQAGFGGSRDVDHGQHRAEEEAWERARTQGVTAHLTGHAPAPGTRDSEEGYVVRNTEEDEAWERARGEGVTAHLTGHDKPRRDGDVV